MDFDFMPKAPSINFTSHVLQCNEDGLCLYVPQPTKDIYLMAAFTLVAVAYTAWSFLGCIGFTWREKAMAMVLLYFFPEIYFMSTTASTPTSTIIQSVYSNVLNYVNRWA